MNVDQIYDDLFNVKWLLCDCLFASVEIHIKLVLLFSSFVYILKLPDVIAELILCALTRPNSLTFIIVATGE